MSRSLKLRLMFCCMMGLLVTAVYAGVKLQSREESIFLFENRKVAIAVPPGFGYNATKDENGICQVKLGDPKNRVSVDIVFLPDPEQEFKSARSRKELLVDEFKGYVESSSEKAMQFEELDPRVGAATYCVFTDSALVGKTELPPGEYIHLTAGLKVWPGVIAIFRVFSNDTKSAEYQETLKLLRESVQEKAVPLK
jgi:hypothetical protein